jgi:sugar phosphate isomerase/epimerase
MFSADADLSSNRPHVRQRAIDYVRRQVEMAREFGGTYLLIVPGAVGRPNAMDAYEFDRSSDALRTVADLFVKNKVKAAIEPIRSAEVSLCHTIADAQEYIDAVNHKGVQHINGDLYHMWTEEAHLGTAILSAGKQLVNLHMADSNRCAFGEGQMDLDTILRALYLIGYNKSGRFCTPEPLGPGGDPYPAMYGKPNPKRLDRLVEKTVRTFRQREAEIKA